jgi:hypothetical protein
MLTLKTETREIDGRNYTVKKFPAMRQVRLLAKLMKNIGPALAGLSKLDPNKDIELGGEAMAGAFENLDPNEAAALIPEILNSTTVMVPSVGELSLAKEGNIDIAFSDDVRTLFKVLGFALQVNFQGFGGGSESAAAPQAAQAG